MSKEQTIRNLKIITVLLTAIVLYLWYKDLCRDKYETMTGDSGACNCNMQDIKAYNDFVKSMSEGTSFTIPGDVIIEGNCQMRNGATVDGKLQFAAAGAQGSMQTDPYSIEKVMVGRESSMRVTINDDPTETFEIWGDSCRWEGGCVGTGRKLWGINADANVHNVGDLTSGGLIHGDHLKSNGLLEGANLTVTEHITGPDNALRIGGGSLPDNASSPSVHSTHSFINMLQFGQLKNKDGQDITGGNVMMNTGQYYGWS